MGLVGSSTTGHSILFKIAPTKDVNSMISHMRRFDVLDVAKERLKIIKFYVSYGGKGNQGSFWSRPQGYLKMESQTLKNNVTNAIALGSLGVEAVKNRTFD